jgi:transcriptional regulator with XRE-family HTH domain
MFAMAKTDGARQLLAWLKKTGKSQRELAELLGIKQPSVSAWCTGSGRPDSVHREALERITGIDRNAWLTAAERRLLQSLGGEAA